MQVLIDHGKALNTIEKYSTLKVLLSIASSLIEDDAEDYLWLSTAEDRKRIAWRWQISESSVKAAIRELSEFNIISSKSRGVYKFNKDYLND